MNSTYAQERAVAHSEPIPLPILRFDPRKQELERWLGSLEIEVMIALWNSTCERTVKGIWKELRGDGTDRAYTTIMTTMTRLWEKGMVSRIRRGLRYTYRTRESRQEFEDRQADAIRASLEGTSW